MSFLPGLGLSAPPSQPPLEQLTRTVTLRANSEWRFEVPSTHSITVKLLLEPSTSDPSINPGTAEVFGTELAPNHTYTFAPLTKAAVYTHHGCALEVTGACDSEYTAEETPMTEYTNLHFALETMRDASTTTSTTNTSLGGPRVLVVGPKDSGKTSLIKTLTSYATRLSRSPLLINLDPSSPLLCLPGSISAAVFGTGATLDVEDAASGGWGTSPLLGGPHPTPIKTPLVYHYGFQGAEEWVEGFKSVTGKLALAATGRWSEQEETRRSGMLVDVGGSACTGKNDYEVLRFVVSEFSINVILVLGSERLYSDMLKRFGTPAPGDEAVHVVRLTKSGGCVDRDEGYMRQYRQAQIRNYFFGGPKNSLSPFTHSGVEYDAIKVLKLVDGMNAILSRAGELSDPKVREADKPAATADPLNFDPGNLEDYAPSTSTAHSSSTIYEPVQPSIAMQGALLTVKQVARNASHDAIRDAPVLGYLYVADVDETKKRLTITSPVRGRLPSEAVVWGSWDGGLAVGMAGLLGG